MTEHMKATEKRLRRNLYTGGSIPHTFEDATGRFETETNQSVITKLAAVNKLKSIPFCNIRLISTETGARIESDKYDKAVFQLMNWVKDGGLEHFREIKKTDYMRTYKLNFGDVETTYQITFERWS